jgi:AAA15 family ATPase/GTPase
VIIESDECTFHADEVGLLSAAIYIDTPFIMDDVKNFYGESYTGFYNTISHRDYLLELLIQRRSNSTVLEEVIFKQKISYLLSNIRSIVGGEFIEDEDNLFFAEQGLKKPVPLSSVSTGIKMFLIIKRLLELGEVKERDVLIFDEPEIHLHPDWQIKFAEILILLQKEFNLTILLTTHSPYFLNAIEVFSKKYNAQKECKFYLAKSDGDVSDVNDVTENIDEVYQQMSLPFQKLDDIAYADDD